MLMHVGSCQLKDLSKWNIFGEDMSFQIRQSMAVSQAERWLLMPAELICTAGCKNSFSLPYLHTLGEPGQRWHMAGVLQSIAGQVLKCPLPTVGQREMAEQQLHRIIELLPGLPLTHVPMYHIQKAFKTLQG